MFQKKVDDCEKRQFLKDAVRTIGSFGGLPVSDLVLKKLVTQAFYDIVMCFPTFIPEMKISQIKF